MADSNLERVERGDSGAGDASARTSAEALSGMNNFASIARDMRPDTGSSMLPDLNFDEGERDTEDGGNQSVEPIDGNENTELNADGPSLSPQGESAPNQETERPQTETPKSTNPPAEIQEGAETDFA